MGESTISAAYRFALRPLAIAALLHAFAISSPAPLCVRSLYAILLEVPPSHMVFLISLLHSNTSQVERWDEERDNGNFAGVSQEPASSE